MRYKIKQFFTLTPADWWVIGQALFLLPVTALALHVMGFNRWFAVLNRWVRGDVSLVPDAVARAERIWQLMRMASRYGLYRGNCLSRSLTLWWLLRQQGLCGELRIGVHKVAGRIQAHAWIEYDERPLNEDGRVHERYAVFDQAIVPRTMEWTR